MENRTINHPPRRLDTTVLRNLEFEHECPECPDGKPDMMARCAECASTMVYRGLGMLKSGLHVHYFECVHSPREVHSVSLIVAE
jgi:hypothetical protein